MHALISLVYSRRITGLCAPVIIVHGRPSDLTLLFYSLVSKTLTSETTHSQPFRSTLLVRWQYCNSIISVHLRSPVYASGPPAIIHCNVFSQKAPASCIQLFVEGLPPLPTSSPTLLHPVTKN